MGSSGGSSEHFLRQLSSSDGGGSALQQEWEYGGGGSSRRGSRRWSRKKQARARGHRRGGGFCRTEEAGRKRVMVVVDQSSGAKHAMMWALTHVATKGDFLTLLHVLPPQSSGGGGGRVDASALANSLGALCKACRPELHAEQQRGVRGGVHQPGGVPDAGGAAAEQGRRRLPHQHPVAEELLAPSLTTLMN
ncbi:unnamed protein product [Urochloa humidicola]